ncbi:MAG: prepilin-type N-terminal cleavage/methylation domain-containing protein [Cyanobacteria bacterium]|nr:prepilin-type N-terminal cleavage/methylation domain-containing protein [Cyanobacteriota bacterium]
MIINSSRVASHRVTTGFTLVELLVTVSISGILASVAFNSMFGFYEQRRLRSAALEVIGMIQEKRVKVAAQRLTSPDNCVSLDPADSSSPINQGMVSGVTGLQVTTETGVTPKLCFTLKGSVETQMTLLLTSTAVADQGHWCVVVTPLLAQTHLGWRPLGETKCSLASSGGSL